jgi:hypothetical protein
MFFFENGIFCRGIEKHTSGAEAAFFVTFSAWAKTQAYLRNNSNGKAKTTTTADPYGMTDKKATARTTAGPSTTPLAKVRELLGSG